jgi:hypothetical protein
MPDLNAWLAPLLATLSAPTFWLFSQPPAIGYTILGVLLMLALIAWGVALAKMRYSPLWVLVLLVPVLVIPALWYIAFARWPIEKRAENHDSQA